MDQIKLFEKLLFNSREEEMRERDGALRENERERGCMRENE